MKLADLIEIFCTLRCFYEYNCGRFTDEVLQMRFATDQKFWQRGQCAASGSVLLFILAPVSFATAQQAVVRDLCSSARWISAEPTALPIAPAPARDSVAQSTSVQPNPASNRNPKLRLPPAPISVDPIEIAKNDRCVHPSPIGVRYNPQLTAKVRRQYEDDLINAKGATKETVVSNVILSASTDVTKPLPISYDRDGDRNDGPTFISISGRITNNNPFPLSSVSIRCDYRDARGVSQSFEFPFRYTLGAGGYIPYQDKVINVLPPHSAVNDISCGVQTAEIWQNTDVIQYLNAPLNPELRPSAPGS